MYTLLIKSFNHKTKKKKKYYNNKSFNNLTKKILIL